MTRTVSEAFATAAAVAEPPATPTTPTPTRPRVPARARDYQSTIRQWAATTQADLRSAWWTPASLPTLTHAWNTRHPDPTRVPGGNPLIATAWSAYNHTIGLGIVLVALTVVALITPLVWAARHPARLALTVVVTTALVALATR